MTDKPDLPTRLRAMSEGAGPEAADEIERLRDALREIAGTGAPDFLSHSQKVARAALKGSSMTDLNALADEVAALDRPSREMDARIAVALTPRTETGCARRVIISHGAQPGHYEWSDISGVSLRTALEYTASIDAALALVPDHHIAGVLYNAQRQIQEKGFPRTSYRQRLIIEIVAAALRAHAHLQETTNADAW